MSVNQSDLLVKASVAMKQLLQDMPPVEPIHPIDPIDPIDPNPPVEPRALNTHFYMSAKLDNTRVNRDVNNYVQEIIQHLMAVDGSEVELKLEVEVTAPDGIPNNVVRTVSENCRTLRVTDFGFND